MEVKEITRQHSLCETAGSKTAFLSGTKELEIIVQAESLALVTK